MFSPRNAHEEVVMLPDVLDFQMKIVFCGNPVGGRSTLARAYYAGPGNKFWPTLYRTGLTPNIIKPEFYSSLRLHDLGLTDYNRDREELIQKILRYAPAVLCFNGKRAAEAFLGRRNLDYGYQREGIGSTRVFVAPSTSSKAGRYWEEKWWFRLADSVGLTVTRVTPDNYYEPDAICRLMENVDSRTGRQSRTTADDFIRAVLDVDLHFSIPLHIRNLFEVAKALFAYGYLYYPFCTLAVEQGLKGLEAVISHKYEMVGGPRVNGSGLRQGLKEKINYLHQFGNLTAQQRDLLHDFRHLRNASFHPRYQQILGHYDGMLRIIADLMDRIWLS